MSDWGKFLIGWTAAAWLLLAACNGGTQTATGGDGEVPDTVNSNSGLNDNQDDNDNANDNNGADNENGQPNNDNQGQQNNTGGEFPSPAT